MKRVIIKTTQNLEQKYSNKWICKKMDQVYSSWNKLNLLQICFKASQSLKANGERVNQIKNRIIQRAMNRNCFMMNQDI